VALIEGAKDNEAAETASAAAERDAVQR
jgi:hypothetical protein